NFTNSILSIPTLFKSAYFLHSTFFIFFFFRTAAHPSLPSFPTRRSSDLLDGQHHPGLQRDRSALVPILPRIMHVQTEPVRGLVQDRKSTRLNSSHVKISYAVFCLKKKRYKLIIITTKQ